MANGHAGRPDANDRMLLVANGPGAVGRTYQTALRDKEELRGKISISLLAATSVDGASSVKETCGERAMSAIIDIIGIGLTDTIHGYNPQFRNTGNNLRFDAFEMHPHHPNRPDRFHFEVVLGTQLLDHQGHVVPQNAYAPRLNFIANQLDAAMQNAGPYDLAAADQYLTNNFGNLHFHHVTNYIQNVLMAQGAAAQTIFVDPNGGNVEDRLGGYFSVINWNPVNISRAPSDNNRGGYPGNNPDNVVALKLLINPAVPTITLPVPFAGFLQNNIGDLVGNIDAFITAGNDCLPLMPQGFYKFNWGVVLGPQL
jgi:hypothetical protein